MLTSIYYSLAIAAYSIFLIQFLVAMFGGTDIDSSMDFDGDGVMDLSWGDIFSFKGFIHFLMGFSGWMSLTSLSRSQIIWYDYVIAITLGIAFVIGLVFLGRLLMKFRCEPTGLSGWDFVGHIGVISIICNSEPNAFYVMVKDLGYQEIKVYSRSGENHNIADEVTIICYEDGKYYIN